MQEYIHITCAEQHGVTIVHLVEEFILNDKLIEGIARELFDLAASQDVPQIIISFQGNKFLSSTVLGKLITLNKRAKAQGGKLVLCEMPHHVSELFVLTNLCKVFDIRDEVAVGVAAFF